jgi:DNA-binding NarL/FixJ family response regulator
MGGKEAIRKLREIDPKVRAIVSSGYSTDPVMSNFITFGFQEAVKKPYQIEEMGKALNSVLTKNTGTAERE